MIEEIKSWLDYTWEDAGRDRKLESYIRSSTQYLNNVAGIEIDYSTDLLARDLLFNRVMYMDSKMLADFGSNYAAEINELRTRYLEKGKEPESI